MLSRMAASLYWIGRYVERAEQTARITDATFNHTLTMGSTPDARQRACRHWEALLEIVGEASAFGDGDQPADEDSVPAHVTFAEENRNSIVNCIDSARENARAMRHQVATEMWEVVNRFHHDVHRPAWRRRATAGPESAVLFCRSVVEFSGLFQGVTDATMPREEGWYFLQAGKFLERAEKTARALDVNYRLLVGDDDALGIGELPPDPQPWANVLRSLSAYESFYRVSATGLRPSAVIDLLTLSPVLPRSIRFSIGSVALALRHITDEAPGYNGSERMPGVVTASEARRAIGRLDSELAYLRLEDLAEHGVHRYLLDLQRQCYRLGELIEEEFFAHRPLTSEELLA